MRPLLASCCAARSARRPLRRGRAVALLTRRWAAPTCMALRRLRQALRGPSSPPVARRAVRRAARRGAAATRGLLAGPRTRAPPAERAADAAARRPRGRGRGRRRHGRGRAVGRCGSAAGSPRRLGAGEPRPAVARGAAADRDLDAVRGAVRRGGPVLDRLPGGRARGLPRPPARGQQIPGDTLAQRAPDGEAVRVLTAHASKGLEWDVVVVVAGVQEGVWPDLRLRGSVLGSERLVDRCAAATPAPPRRDARPTAAAGCSDEERRLFYVAVTRARARLLVTAVTSERRGGRPSRFLDELGPLGPRGRGARADAGPARPLTLHRRWWPSCGTSPSTADDPAARAAACRRWRWPRGSRRPPPRRRRRTPTTGGACAPLSDDAPLVRDPERDGRVSARRRWSPSCGARCAGCSRAPSARPAAPARRRASATWCTPPPSSAAAPTPLDEAALLARLDAVCPSRPRRTVAGSPTREQARAEQMRKLLRWLAGEPARARRRPSSPSEVAAVGSGRAVAAGSTGWSATTTAGWSSSTSRPGRASRPRPSSPGTRSSAPTSSRSRPGAFAESTAWPSGRRGARAARRHGARTAASSCSRRWPTTDDPGWARGAGRARSPRAWRRRPSRRRQRDCSRTARCAPAARSGQGRQVTAMTPTPSDAHERRGRCRDDPVDPARRAPVPRSRRAARAGSSDRSATSRPRSSPRRCEPRWWSPAPAPARPRRWRARGLAGRPTAWSRPTRCSA